MSEITASNLEAQRKALQEQVDLTKAIERLYLNPDFQSVILDQFMTKEAARFVQSSIDPNLDSNKRADALGMAQASGYLRQFLEVSKMIGHQADYTITQIDNELEDMRANGEDE